MCIRGGCRGGEGETGQEEWTDGFLDNNDESSRQDVAKGQP